MRVGSPADFAAGSAGELQLRTGLAAATGVPDFNAVQIQSVKATVTSLRLL